MHDHQLHGVTAAVVVGLEPERHPQALGRRFARPCAELDRSEPPALLAELEFHMTLADDAPRQHLELAIEQRFRIALSPRAAIA